MAPVLYVIPYSQPVRATLMTIKALNINIQLQEINLMEKQQLSSEFTQLNPQHTVPTLVEDDGFILWESHAIMPYLVDKYGTEDSLYPINAKQRAIVNQRLHFNNGVLFPLNIFGPIFYKGEKKIPQAIIENVKEAYSFLERFLEGQQWVAGSSVTIADFAIIATVTSLDIVVPIDPETDPNIFAWMRRAEELPCYGENRKGLEQFRRIVAEKMK